LGLAALVILPSLTWTEHLRFALAGIPLHVRFLAYGGSAAALGAAAGILVLTGIRLPRTWSAIVIASLLWFALTIALAGQPLREWLPTALRWTMYFSAATIGFAAASSMKSSTAIRQYWTAVACALVVPTAAALIELTAGSAKVLNNAQRISGTMNGHPVAFSLFLAVGVLMFVPMTFQLGGRARAVAWLGIGSLYVAMLFTFTRATVVMLPVAAVVGAALVPVAGRRRLRRAASGIVMVVALLLISIPFIQARAGDEPPMQVELPGNTVGPGQSPPAGPRVTPPFVIDNSTGLRFETHAFGLAYVLASPVVGHGPGSFDRLFERDTGKVGVAAHDDFLLAAVETGLVGLLLLVMLYSATVWKTLTALRTESMAQRSVGISVASAFILVNIILAIHNPTYFPEVQLPIWLGAGIAMRLGLRSASDLVPS
jgi:O-antigen ligase